MFKGINAIEFGKRFYDNESCYLYLIELKWGKGFNCSRCGHDKFYSGKTYYHRQCRSCSYGESVTANTIFHGIKMPILKAFHMVFRLTAKKKGMSTTELGNEVGVQQKTAWLFKRKVQVVMKQNNNDKLKDNVDADETIIGGYTNKNKGRSLQTKEAVLIAAEKLADGRTGNIRMQQIENFEALTLRYALKDMVDDKASIVTDHHRSYQHLKKDMNIVTVLSKMGQSLEELHKQIMQFKNWLRGIHHKCSKQHLFAYADEYVFRFNRRNNRKVIFHKVVSRMMNQVPHPYTVLKTLFAYST
jgi:ISXO2-like transposase domain/Transposase zinc-ribbon domain